MNPLRTLTRLLLLSLAAALCVLLTARLGAKVPAPSPAPRYRMHRSLAPRITELPEFLGEALLLAACTTAGRLIFRLRLSPTPRKQQPLNLFKPNV